MYHKEFNIGNKKFVFMFTHKPYYTDENTIVMGFPYNMDPINFDENKVEQIKGYFTYIKFTQDSVIVINDILGNYRTYYMEKDGITYFSNDFLSLFNLQDKNQRYQNKMAIEYWKRHRLIVGGESFSLNIKKIIPANIYTFTQDKITSKIYFKDIENVPNRNKHSEEIYSDLQKTVSLIKNMPQKKFLLFSGGADSTLCVKLLQEQGVDFTPIFAKHTPTNSMNFDDILKVKYAAKKLGITPIEIEVDTNKEIPDEVINIMFTDRNITQLFFVINKYLREKYGEDILLITGQNADYVFGYGPTEKAISRNFVRSLLFNGFPILNKVIFEIIKLFRPMYRNYRVFTDTDEYLHALLDDKNYLPIIDKFVENNYYKWIDKFVALVKSNFVNLRTQIMYLKIIGYMQGSDNYVNVQAPEYEGLHSVFLFTTPEIIYSTIKNTDYKYEITHPKSVVYKILKEKFNYTMPNIKKEKNYNKNIKKEITFNQYEANIDKIFYSKLESLDFTKENKN